MEEEEGGGAEEGDTSAAASAAADDDDESGRMKTEANAAELAVIAAAPSRRENVAARDDKDESIVRDKREKPRERSGRGVCFLLEKLKKSVITATTSTSTQRPQNLSLANALFRAPAPLDFRECECFGYVQSTVK